MSKNNKGKFSNERIRDTLEEYVEEQKFQRRKKLRIYVALFLVLACFLIFYVLRLLFWS